MNTKKQSPQVKPPRIFQYLNSPPRLCLGCLNNIDGNPRKQYCSDECKVKHKSHLRYTGIEGIDYLVCPACKIHTRQFTPDHAKMHGYCSIKEMATALNIDKITCTRKKELSRGENNPAYQHNGKYSAWSKNFIHGYNKENHLQKNKNQSNFVRENKEKFKNNIEYWLAQTDGNIEEATKLHKKSQTRDLAFFVGKYGEIEGTHRHATKIQKWITSFKKCNFSKISQSLFVEIIKNISQLENIYFATYNRQDMEKYSNKEYILRVKNTYIRPDFICLTRKKIIEFDDTYWHSAARANPLREQMRDAKIKEAGYLVLHISENEYNQNKQQVIDKCLHFLNQ